MQSVLPVDWETNFLMRREIIIFAADAKSQFTAHNPVDRATAGRLNTCVELPTHFYLLKEILGTSQFQRSKKCFAFGFYNIYRV